MYVMIFDFCTGKSFTFLLIFVGKSTGISKRILDFFLRILSMFEQSVVGSVGTYSFSAIPFLYYFDLLGNLF